MPTPNSYGSYDSASSQRCRPRAPARLAQRARRTVWAGTSNVPDGGETWGPPTAFPRSRIVCRTSVIAYTGSAKRGTATGAHGDPSAGDRSAPGGRRSQRPCRGVPRGRRPVLVVAAGGWRRRVGGRARRRTIRDLCGHCAQEKCAIGPTGDMWPCVLGRFLTMGNAKSAPVAGVWNGARAAQVTADLAAVHGSGVQSCTPPQFLPMCGPCGPCVPSVGHCDPREASNAEAPAIGASV